MLQVVASGLGIAFDPIGGAGDPDPWVLRSVPHELLEEGFGRLGAVDLADGLAEQDLDIEPIALGDRLVSPEILEDLQGASGLIASGAFQE